MKIVGPWCPENLKAYFVYLFSFLHRKGRQWREKDGPQRAMDRGLTTKYPQNAEETPAVSSAPAQQATARDSNLQVPLGGLSWKSRRDGHSASH